MAREPLAHIRPSSYLIPSMAAASGLAVANIYYNQPMLADMARAFHAGAHEIGLVATFTQLGYAAGMPAFIPLGDLLERRRLIVMLFLAAACALVAAAMAPNLAWLSAASFFIGLTTIIAQIMIPLATELMPPSRQGQTIGSILSGVLLGILLARTLSGFVARYFGWRFMFWLAAAIALAAAAAMRAVLPRIPPRAPTKYGALMRSLWEVARGTPKLRQISFVAALFFAAFSVFWTTLVFRLEAPPYRYGSEAAGLFGLVGAVGAAVAPLAGRLADRRSPLFVVANAVGVVFFSFLVFWGLGGHVWGMVAGVILLDAGIQAAQVANQTRVLALYPESRNRINTIYMICYFSGGSAGSLLGSFAWSHWQWPGVCIAGLSLMLLAALGLLAGRGAAG